MKMSIDRTMLLLFVIAINFGITGCNTSDLLRDNYMGKKWLEPNLMPEAVKRDNDGNVKPKT